MYGDLNLFNEIERYLKGEMTETERANFDMLRKEDADLDHKVVEQEQFVQRLTNVGNRRALRTQLNAIHSEIDVNELKGSIQPKEGKIIQLFRRYRANIAVAATVAFFTVIGTLLITKNTGSEKQNSSYSALRRDMESIKRSQNALIRNINSTKTKMPATPGSFGGTSFVLSTDGFLITNYHVINGADSIYIQNEKGEAYKVKTVYSDPSFDLAVLKIDDPSFKSFGSLPYTFKKSKSDLGEEVFTLGFPRDEMVYGKGYLSAATGFGGDTIAYQVSIPANPGNSGGPVVDNKGNVVGVISGKQTLTEGATFAVRSQSVLKFINSIPQDSLKSKITVTKKNTLSGLSRTQQIKKLQDYVYMVKVYN
ncbi:S1C family serine protease [Solitalea canadensis]|uniref:Trypsin-like serine protease with C-terminal PDZ domain n=1 Tax=Solitalea canadensis (strain ATCC 29591 / DSM 3403 / JCM 21819 / LMG 8368 / NBRC 15130 / NCIMB 12057 / USAM 9D) TaxID=929556 RepID=H8KTV1_SOLCM|nr:serine protease [Solitalea canadensis]AFD06801.1 trypsin-like serine protease with C-terminal PDZ domain [Solitalea canadensis DSM 3403]